MPRLFIARKLSLDPRRVLGAEVDIDLWDSEMPPPRDELLSRVARADGLLALLTERVDQELLDAAPSRRRPGAGGGGEPRGGSRQRGRPRLHGGRRLGYQHA